jgi:hypothetical protein
MRRIIERTVTVITTTTWKISWQEDALPSNPRPDSADDESLKPVVFPETVQHTEQFSPVTEEQEDDLWVIKRSPDKRAGEPPDQHIYQ